MTATTKKIGILLLTLGAILVLTLVLNRFVPPAEGSLAAKVNNQNITVKELEEKFKISLATLKVEGVNVEETQYEDLRKEVLNNLISEILILEYADKNNIEASQEEVDGEYNALVFSYNGEENLKSQLEAFQVSQEQFFKNLKKNVIFRKSIENFIGPENISVTEQEIQKTYETLEAEVKKANLESNLPPYKEAKEWLAIQLRNQKIMEQAGGFVSKLREESQIKVFL